MLGRCAKCKWELGMNSTVTSHLELVVVVYGQEPIDWGGFDAVCTARVNALLRHYDLDDNKDFMRDVTLQSWLGLEDVNRRWLRE